MSRNKEKHVVKLNRLWLQSLDEENLKKNPPRPGLGSLKTASEVKKWIPSIKKDIDFCLKQSQVTCYPESHIQDLSSRIEALTREYKAYVRKLRELEPQAGAVPWTDRPYKRKHMPQGGEEGSQDTQGNGDPDPKVTKPDFAAITAPLLDTEDSYSELYGYDEVKSETVQMVDADFEDRPLVFRSKQLSIEAPSSHSSGTSELRAGLHQCDTGAADSIGNETEYKNIEESHHTCGSLLNDRQTRNDFSTEKKECDELEVSGSEKLNKDCMACQERQLCSTSTCGAKSYHTSGSGTTTVANEGLKLFIPYSDSSSDEDNNT